jgi:hypothetical protein
MTAEPVTAARPEHPLHALTTYSKPATGSPLPGDRRHQIGRLTAAELNRYRNQLARCLKALDTTAPIRGHLQRELAAVRAEQDDRARLAADV